MARFCGHAQKTIHKSTEDSCGFITCAKSVPYNLFVSQFPSLQMFQERNLVDPKTTPQFRNAKWTNLPNPIVFFHGLI